MHLRHAGIALLALLTVGGTAQADAPLVTDNTWKVAEPGKLLVDGGLVVGFPAALPTGLSTGVGAGVTCGCGLFAWGARLSWATATESTTTWEVTHADLRMRLTGALQHSTGRGTVALRLGLGGTLVHETRLRNQGMRSGLTGSDLQTSAFDMLPAADLEAVVMLRIAGPWALAVSAGPSLVVHDGGAHAGWTSELGVVWQP